MGYEISLGQLWLWLLVNLLTILDFYLDIVYNMNVSYESYILIT